MGVVAELQYFKQQVKAMNRKLDRIIQLLEMWVELQCENSEKGDDDPEIE